VPSGLVPPSSPVEQLGAVSPGPGVGEALTTGNGRRKFGGMCPSRKWWLPVLAVVLVLSASAARVGAAVQVNRAAWYLGATSAGTPIDFRLSPSGAWARDFHFGAPPLTCAGAPPDPPGTPQRTLEDGAFPLLGVPATPTSFAGVLSTDEATPNTADQTAITVHGQLTAPDLATGTIDAEDRGCRYRTLTFSATRAAQPPAQPITGRRYVGHTQRGAPLSFLVSRSGRVRAFHVAPRLTHCKETDQSGTLALSHSYPIAGLAQGSDGTYTGTLGSRTGRRRPADTRIRVVVLFLTAQHATGLVRLLGSQCTYETLRWNADLTG
jgi:hypothetical protein